MSREVLWQVVGRARADLAFGQELREDAPRALAGAGYELDPREIEDVKNFLATGSDVPGPGAVPPAMQGGIPMRPEDVEFQRAMMKDRFTKQMARMDKLNDYSLSLIMGTFDSAKSTYRTITWMNRIMFVVGIALFLFAGLYTVFAEQKIYSLVFCGLGAASFVALFLLGPIDKTQRALSNLVQAEVAFMNYFDQLTFWENYAQIPRQTPQGGPDPLNIERASQGLQERSRETMELLQLYVEDRDPQAREKPPRAKRGDATPADS